MSGLPSLGRGRPTEERRARYEADLEPFCERIREINSGLDFQVGSGGWCYLLEQEGVITKGEFNAARQLTNDCRKSGALPLEICAHDDKRAANGLEKLDYYNIEARVEWIVNYVQTYASRAHWGYTPSSFWDDLNVFIEIAVEKSDPKSLFGPVASSCRIPIQNVGGWSDLHARADMMQRFASWERKGKTCVLLYCGDHDPSGLHIREFIRSNLADMSRAVGWSPDNLIIERFGLTFDFIEQHSLTWIDNLETGDGKRLDDEKHRNHFKPYAQNYIRQFGARKVEANALVVRREEGRKLCRQAILRYIPESAKNDYSIKIHGAQLALREAIAARLAA
jgi:hypothetical protein